MDREEKTFLRAMGYVLAAFVVMTWSLWALAPQTPPAATPNPPSTPAAAPAPPAPHVTTSDTTASGVTFSAAATYPPLVEHGFEVLGPTSRRPGDPAPGQRYFDTDLNTYSIFTGASWQAVNVSAGIGNIDDIGDVSAVSPSVGEFLGWNGSAWSNLTLSLSTLTDAEVTSATPGQSLRFNGSNFVNTALGVDDLAEITIGSWEEGETLRYNGSGLVDSKLSLYDLSNLNVSSPANGQVLSYNSSTAKWVNSTLSVTTNLDGLSDVVINSATFGDFLGYNGTTWVDTTISLDTLTDAAVGFPIAGEVLRYNGTNFVDAVLDVDDLANVAITGWATGEVLRYNGTSLVDATLSVDDLSEVTVTSWASGETLRWNGSALVDSKLQLNDLSDLNLSSLSDNQFLRYDGGTSKIVNETVDVPADLNYFVVTEYNATADDGTDDTTAIQTAFDAAATYTAANPLDRATVYLPRGVYIVNGAVGSGAVTVSGSRITVLGEGTLKLANGDDADAVLEIQGDYVTVERITVDGNGASNPTGRNECIRVETDGIASGDPDILVRDPADAKADFCTLRGVICQNTESGGTASDTFFVRGDYALVEGCTSVDSGNNGFRNDGDYCVYKNNRCISCEAKGFTQNGQDREQLTVDGFFCYYDEDNVAAGCGFQVDVGVEAGGGSAAFNGFSLSKADLRNINVFVSDDVVTDFGSGIKLARIHQVVMDGFHVRMSDVGSTALKLAEGLGQVTLRNGFVSNNIDMDMSPYDPGGSVTSVTEEAVTGKAVLNSASHVVKDGDYLIVSGSSVEAYNGLYQITQSPTSGLIVINADYTADATATFSNCCGHLKVENVIIGDRVHDPGTCLSGLAVYDLEVKNCEFRNYVYRGISYQPFTSFPETAPHSLYVTQSFFESNCPGDTEATATAPIAAGDSGTSNEWNNRSASFVRFDESNVIRDLGSVTSLFTSAFTEAGNVIFTRRSRAMQRYVNSSTTLTAADHGTVYFCDAADLVMTLPPTEPGLRYTFVLGPNGLSTTTGLSISPNSADRIYMPGISPAAADNKDIILDDATDRVGDAITVVGDRNIGWIVESYSGTWAREP